MTAKAFRALTLLLAVVVGAPSAVAQTPIQVTGPGRVTVRANAVPLGDLLQQLSVMATMDRLRVAPDALSAPVTIEIEDAAVDVAILAVLKASNVDYVLSGTRLLAGGTSQAAPLVERRERGEAAASLGPVPLLPRYNDPNDDTPAKRAAAAMSIGMGGGGSDAAAGVPMSAPANESADQFGFLVGVEAVKFRVVGDSAVIETPGFVPYKLRPEVIARRLAIDVAKIP